MKKSDNLKHVLRKTAAGILCLSMAASMMFSGSVQAEDHKLNYLSLPEADFPAPAPEKGVDLQAAQASIPAKYSSVSKKYITKVKDQNPFGTCWTFAAMNAIEASAIKNKVKVGGSVLNNKNIDLAEYQLAYFFFHKKTDPLKLIAGDYAVSPMGDIMEQGGNNCLTSLYLASWAGPTRETVAPYSKVSRYNYPSLSNAKAFTKDVLHVQNVYWADMSNRTKVKQLIKQCGAVAIAYYHDDYYYNSATGSYYCPYNKGINHSVSVVGWDDNYSRSKFGYDSPNSNGAWLVKNSWGSGWGNSGYFWLSYEDYNVQNNYINTMAVGYGTTPATTYKYNYQYDGGSFPNWMQAGEKFSIANIYKCIGSQTLKAVGFGCWENSQKYTIQVYKNPKKGKPTSGSKILGSGQSGSINAGFRTIKLKKAVNLKKGDTFSVVITLRNSGTNNALMDSQYYDGSSFDLRTTEKSGQSYIIYRGKSYDLAKNYSSLGSNIPMTARIKAYTTN